MASVSKAERTAKRTRVPMQISVKKGVGGGPASIHEVAGILPQLAASGRNVTLVDGAKLFGLIQQAKAAQAGQGRLARAA